MVYIYVRGAESYDTVAFWPTHLQRLPQEFTIALSRDTILSLNLKTLLDNHDTSLSYTASQEVILVATRDADGYFGDEVKKFTQQLEEAGLIRHWGGYDELLAFSNEEIAPWKHCQQEDECLEEEGHCRRLNGQVFKVEIEKKNGYTLIKKPAPLQPYILIKGFDDETMMMADWPEDPYMIPRSLEIVCSDSNKVVNLKTRDLLESYFTYRPLKLADSNLAVSLQVAQRNRQQFEVTIKKMQECLRPRFEPFLS